MHKSFELLKTMLKEIDLVIEVKDSRAPTVSANQELQKIFQNKPILSLSLKKDLADLHAVNDASLHLFDCLSHNHKKAFVQLIEKTLSDKINKLKNKGLINPILKVLICGLPNVGKSTIINQLVGKKVAQIADSPG